MGSVDTIAMPNTQLNGVSTWDTVPHFSKRWNKTTPNCREGLVRICRQLERIRGCPGYRISFFEEFEENEPGSDEVFGRAMPECMRGGQGYRASLLDLEEK